MGDRLYFLIQMKFSKKQLSYSLEREQSHLTTCPSRTDQLQIIAFQLRFICDTNNSKPQAELVMMVTTM